MATTLAWIIVITLLLILFLYSGVITCVLLLGVNSAGKTDSEVFELPEESEPQPEKLEEKENPEPVKPVKQ